MPARIVAVGTAAVVVIGATVLIVHAAGHDNAPAAATTTSASATTAAPATSAPATSAPPTTAPPTTAPPTTAAPTTAAVTTAPTTAPVTTAPIPPATGLDGTWNGTWKSLAFPVDGTFLMKVTVTDGNIHGTIVVHAPGSTERSKVAGTFDGKTITFGAVKGFAVTFTGTLNGDTTSGTWKANNGSGDHGTWTANRA